MTFQSHTAILHPVWAVWGQFLWSRYWLAVSWSQCGHYFRLGQTFLSGKTQPGLSFDVRKRRGCMPEKERERERKGENYKSRPDCHIQGERSREKGRGGFPYLVLFIREEKNTHLQPQLGTGGQESTVTGKINCHAPCWVGGFACLTRIK